MRMIASLTLLFASALTIATSPSLAEEPKGDLAKLQGSWTAQVGPVKDVSAIFSIKGGLVELRLIRPNGDVLTHKGEIKLDEKASPKTAEWINFTGPDGRAINDNKLIYKLEGDSWTTCSGGPGKDRPTEFASGAGGPPILISWTRDKGTALKGDLAKIQGTWLAPAGPNDEVVIKLTVTDKTYVARWDRGDGTSVELKGDVRINEDAKTKTIDFVNSQRNDGDDARDNLGIYTFDGEKFKVCLGGAGNERPTEFKKGDGGAPMLLIFTKKKD